MTDVQDGILDAIYRAASTVSDVELVRSLLRHGFSLLPSADTFAVIQSTVDAENKVSKHIKMDRHWGGTVYTWTGPHVGARRSIANLYFT
jgi:hypothetical protein